MDFNDTPREAEFRAEAKSWLAEHAPKFEIDNSTRALLDPDEGLKRGKAWQALKADAGYACMTWPEQYGGRNAPMIEQVVFNEEEAKYNLPVGYFEIGLGMCAPTMMAYATEEQNQRYIPKMIRGEEVWCQLFSEPAAGSDVAGLQMTAQQDGDEWILNGQKVWTSGAHYCDYGIIVTRSDPTVPKHKGLTFFFIDMKAPGIDIRPIEQISGQSNFNEVFFENVRVPDSQRLGAIGEGWGVAITTLMNERLAIGEAPPPHISDLLDLAREIEFDHGPAIQDSGVRQKLAEWFVESQGLKYGRYRMMTALSKGDTPGPEASITKVVSAKKLQDMCAFAMELEDMGGALMEEDVTPHRAFFQEGFLYSPGYRVAGGTDEILRNIIAERVLGMPQDIRVDKSVPFKELPTGAQ
jgi:alkylation response protein AidB-like acyl-CoA dehydrogenase